MEVPAAPPKKPTPPKPKNQTYSTMQDRILTKDSILGGSIKIPKGTRFTAHQNGDKKGGPEPIYTASVDRVVNGKIKPSTVFYCNGKNAGKFWNGSANSWFYDKTKVLSGYLLKNLCGKSLGDQYYFENADQWREDKEQKEQKARCAEIGQYTDAKGNRTCYDTSTEYQKNYQFLKSQGLMVDGIQGYTMQKPTTANQHFNLVALYSMKYLTDIQINSIGWNNTECMRIGLASIKSTPHKTKYLTSYDSSVKSLIENPKSRLYTAPNFSKTVTPYYANFVLSDFYFDFGKLVADVGGERPITSLGTVYFPEGVYNFMAQYYGSTNVGQITRVLKTYRAACQGGGLTAEQGHQLISTLTMISAFIPVVGPFIAAGLGTVDAAILYSQGKKGEAALTAALSLIPFAAEIPALKGIGQQVFESIATKTISKLPFTGEELVVLEKISGAKAEFDELAKKWIKSKTASPVVQEFVTLSKKKGEEYLVNKMSETVGVPLKYAYTEPKKIVGQVYSDTKKAVTSTVKDNLKAQVKKYDAQS